MKHRARLSTLQSALPAIAAASALFAVGCETTIGDNGDDGNPGGPNAGNAGSSGSSSGEGGTAGTTAGTSGASGASGASGMGGTSGVGGAGGAGGTTGVPCAGTHVTTMKRLVRLTDNQLVNTYNALFGAAATTALTMTEDIPAAYNRSFPPLSEGGTQISPMLWSLTDRMGQGIMPHIAANLATLTTCGATPTDMACGQAAVLAFAQKAFRRPLTPEETTAIQTELWAEMTTDGATVADAIKYGFYGILSAPEFLYRTEFGTDPNVDGELSQYEIASELSYFVTDGPPDADLLAAAAGGQLTNKDTVRAQVTRLLGTPAARANLEAAMLAYFQLSRVPTVVIDAAAAPGITVSGGLLSSMFREAELFMANTLWAGQMTELVTSKRSWVNSQIAMPIYGVAAASADTSIFSEVMLPADRSGLLTLSPFLTSKSRAQGTSVVGRGLAVNAALVCSANPAFPEDDPTIADAIAMQAGWSEKRKADFRADPTMGAACFGCHAQFDAMGLVLENYDAVGRYRTMDLLGNTIDVPWTTSRLPEAFDYDQNADGVVDPVVVSNPVMLAEQLIRTGALERCMAMNFINFALADESQGSARAPITEHPTNSCAVKHVVDNFNVTPTDKSFSALIREIAASDTLAMRTRGM